MSPETEYKTIRIDAMYYYKIIELSGLMTTLTGTKIPISIVAATAIDEFYDEYYNQLKDTLNDPEKMKGIRNNLKEILVSRAKSKLSGDDMKKFMKEMDFE